MLGATAPSVRFPIPYDVGRIGEACSRRILLVEDDGPVRSLLALALRLAGYEVHVAATAAEALDLAETLPSIDVVVADVGLPRTTGPDLVRMLQEERPGLEALHITGHADETAARLGLDPAALRLRKPFSPGELVAVVAALAPTPAAASA
jgi:two-component system cell cycle sensor histidine kinase/response regulator CckA